MVSSSWLTKQRKAALIELAEQAGLEMYAQMTNCRCQSLIIAQ